MTLRQYNQTWLECPSFSQFKDRMEERGREKEKEERVEMRERERKTKYLKINILFLIQKIVCRVY
jgi:hypothetical protein